jgi:NADH dehydrogenase
MIEKTVAVAGGAGFIGRAIVRRIAAMPSMRVRVLTRNPQAAQNRGDPLGVDFVRAEVTEPATLKPALAGVDAIVCAVQFEGYPVEDPSRGLTFDRIDLGGAVALLDAAKAAGASQFIYISGAAADEASTHPGFRAKGRAERAVRESGLAFTIFRPSLVYGPGDRVANNFARLLKFTPVFPVPGTGRQKLQPVLVDDLAACVALALTGRGRNGTYDVGGPELMTFDDFVKLLMEVTGRLRSIIHIPEGVMRAIGAVAERLPKPMLSRDAVTFVTADNACNIGPLIDEFGIKLTPAREGLAYLAAHR